MTRAADRRLAGFLSVSAALHLLCLAIPLPTRTLPQAAVPLVAHLAPPAPAQKSVVATRLGTSRGALPAETSDAVAPIQTQDATIKVDLDTAFATARRLAKETPAAPTAQPQTTMAAAVASALRNSETVETRGASGEYVTITGKTRCVTPLLVPHFLEGKTMLTQCETRKG